MTRTLFAIFAIAIIAGCGGDSALPVATGKGSIRMINAIPTSPEIGFLIEERVLDGVAYKSNSTPQDWDDLTYTFNFEISRPRQLESGRIASQFLDVVRDIEYTFVVRGSVDAPVVDIWQIPEREFSGTDTVFEMRAGHAADALGTVDVYLGLASAAPDLGNLVATLAPGEVSAPADVEPDTFVITVTSAGDPADIIYRSGSTPILSNQSVLITVFEGDANDTAPVTVRVFNQTGASSAVPDARFPPTARFVHATTQLGTSDLYDDEALQNRIVANLAFGDITGDIDMGVGEIPITATALADEVNGAQVPVDRRSIETVARLTFFHSASNHEFVDLYLVESGTSIEDVLPRQIALGYGLQSAALGFTAGSYDLYITTSGEKTVLDGPISLEATLGDVFEAVLLDRVDPALAEFKLFPTP